MQQSRNKRAGFACEFTHGLLMPNVRPIGNAGLMQSLPFYCRWWFALVLVAVLAGAGVLCFLGLRALDPIADLDYRFFLRVYTGIGATAGFASCYFSRLVARRRVSATSFICLLLAAYIFVMILALDKNPIVATIATVIFGFILSLVFLADRSVRSVRSA